MPPGCLLMCPLSNEDNQIIAHVVVSGWILFFWFCQNVQFLELRHHVPQNHEDMFDLRNAHHSHCIRNLTFVYGNTKDTRSRVSGRIAEHVHDLGTTGVEERSGGLRPWGKCDDSGVIGGRGRYPCDRGAAGSQGNGGGDVLDACHHWSFTVN